MERLFWKHIRDLESRYLDQVEHKRSSAVRRSTTNFYKDVSLKDYKVEFPIYPVIPSWALLQPSHRSSINAGENQMTGINIASKDIGKKIATWRTIGGERPIFRLWYIQFLFFHQKNLSIFSFYYDFITKKTYSEHIESYQYNHITNYSYTDEDISYMSQDPMIKYVRLPEQLSNNIFGNEVKTISLASASGSYYRCVIPDNDVTKGLNSWLDFKYSEDQIAEQKLNLKPNEKEKLFENAENYEGLIETLAWLSFKELKNKVAKFTLSEHIV